MELVPGSKNKHEIQCLANPVVVAGRIPKKMKTTANRNCRFCAVECEDADEHEDVCAPSHVTRYMCPFTADGKDCLYFSIDEHRAERHAHNRRQPDEDDGFKCPMHDPSLKPFPQDVEEIVVRRI
jgi:hypothetical protein